MLVVCTDGNDEASWAVDFISSSSLQSPGKLGIEKWADRREEWASGQKYGVLANLSSDARPYLNSPNRRTK